MGFLAFLQRRQGDRTSLSPSPSTVTLQRSNASSSMTAKIRSRSDADLASHQHTYRPQHTNQLQHQQTAIANPSTTALQQAWTADAQSDIHPNELITSSDSAKRLSAASSFSDLLLSRNSSVKGAGAFSVVSRHVDLLDAQGQLGPSDFKARLQASGSREYGEDVAERNIGQNGLLLGSPAVQRFYATRSLQAVPRRQNTAAARYRKYANKEVILEQPEIEDAYRPSSRASSIYTSRSTPVARSRVTSIFDSPVYTEPPQTGRASVASSRATVSSIGLPKLEEASNHRQDMDTEESDDAFPPSIPRFRRSEPESSSMERPPSTLGSVRRARQSVDVMSAYNMGEPITRTVVVEKLFQDDFANTRPASRNQRNGAATQRQNLSVENMLRWRQTFGELEEDQRSVATERATESRASQRQWSIASTEPTERSDVSSVFPRPVSRATATTSVDIRSLMDLDERNSCKGGRRRSSEAERGGGSGSSGSASHDEEDNMDDACSITTDGSNVDAFMEKRQRRRAAAGEDQALIFKESEFFGDGDGGGGALPGLFGPSSLDDAVPEQEDELASEASAPAPAPHGRRRDSDQTLKAPVCSAQQQQQASQDDRRCSSSSVVVVAGTPEPLPGPFVPRIYLTQRQRLLALGFDYDTDDDEFDALDSSSSSSSDPDDARTLKPRLSIIVEGPPAAPAHGGGAGGEDAAASSRRRIKEASKRLTRGGGARVRRVETSLEEEGNLADVE
ncbi:hypothetical protein IF1G_11300 [Cordyceps javanica]|uniref:Uncharacterized protein n=1 Tax=Cordyceps javanica TaxID=43265 RepID=A0A545VKK0_9HYPO|nr:hypothetical protein IF1G_11300 [Cordyceps javanica]TQW02176.1 hypothetical protein IF2G_10381 [Cordyceps javanica]